MDIGEVVDCDGHITKFNQEKDRWYLLGMDIRELRVTWLRTPQNGIAKIGVVNNSILSRFEIECSI